MSQEEGVSTNQSAAAAAELAAPACHQSSKRQAKRRGGPIRGLVRLVGRLVVYGAVGVAAVAINDVYRARQEVNGNADGGATSAGGAVEVTAVERVG